MKSTVLVCLALACAASSSALIFDSASLRPSTARFQLAPREGVPAIRGGGSTDAGKTALRISSAAAAYFCFLFMFPQLKLPCVDLTGKIHPNPTECHMGVPESEGAVRT